MSKPSGRQLAVEPQPTILYSVQLPVALRLKLGEVARAEGVSASDLVREAIAEHLAAIDRRGDRR